MDRISITRPDDWHLHLRDGPAHGVGARGHGAAVRARDRDAEPAAAGAHHPAGAALPRAHPRPSCPRESTFEPLMTLYLTDDTPAEEIARAKLSGRVHGVKLYPAGATTHSDAGVTRISRCFAALEKMEQLGLPLLIHGEIDRSRRRRVRPREGVHRGSARPDGRALRRAEDRARAHHHARRGAVRRGHRRRTSAPPSPRTICCSTATRCSSAAFARTTIACRCSSAKSTARRWSRRRPPATRNSSSAPTARRTRAGRRRPPAAAPASTRRTRRSSSTPRLSRRPARSTSSKASPATTARDFYGLPRNQGTHHAGARRMDGAENAALRQGGTGAAACRRNGTVEAGLTTGPGSRSCTHPIFDSVREWLGRIGDTPTLELLNSISEERNLKSESGKPVRFVPPAAADPYYEIHLYETGRVQTRPESKHDLFNALVWLAFPQTKARINAMHAAEIPNEGRQARAAARHAHHLRRRRCDRGRRQGSRNAGARSALARTVRRAPSRFPHRRSWPCGPRAGPRPASRHYLQGDFCRPVPRSRHPGRALACDDRQDSPRDLPPLPVFGYPGWFPGNGQPAFYSDERYFRPLQRTNAQVRS